MTTILRVLPPSRAGRPDFAGALAAHGTPELRRASTTTLQVNVGRRCNQACNHCHVEAGPLRTESMSDATFERLLALLRASPSIRTVDVTGGAPELHPRFRELVSTSRGLGLEVIDRCNLTILEEPGMEDLATFLASSGVQIVASLPCYQQANVDKQRGRGVFETSMRALSTLNGLGYGVPGTGLSLDLVYNPAGASLPPAQAGLEARYRDELRRDHGIEFTRLITITNMPIRRFEHALLRDGLLEAYESLLVRSFNPATIPALMCRSLVSIAWDGGVHDCDFNQMLDLPCGALVARQGRATLFELDSFESLVDAPITVDSHCFGCTAGAGSSCGGALSP